MAASPQKQSPISPTFTGSLPHLEIDLTHCEAGDPCREAVKAQAATLQDHARREVPAYVCRIHQVRRFFESMGWIAQAKKATTGTDPAKEPGSQSPESPNTIN